MRSTVRRVVTSQSPGGRSKIFSDAAPPTVFDIEGGPSLIEIWKTSDSPVSLRCDDEEPASGALLLQPPAGGSVFRIADIPPDAVNSSDADHARAVFEQMGAADRSTQGDGAEHGGLMHRTPTLDYGIVLEGSITLVVDEGEVELHAGDVVIQRGSNHAWSNRSGKTCRMAFVMIDATYPSV